MSLSNFNDVFCQCCRFFIQFWDDGVSFKIGSTINAVDAFLGGDVEEIFGAHLINGGVMRKPVAKASAVGIKHNFCVSTLIVVAGNKKSTVYKHR